MALTYAALCMQAQARSLKSVTRLLTDELARQVLPDGGHASRNPGALIELLLDLLPLRQAFAARNVPPPAALNNAIDRMMPMLRFFRHGDGNFALFNGMGPTRTELVSTVLAYDDARGMPVANAPHSGYQRVQVGRALLHRRRRPAAAAADELRGARRLPLVRAVVEAFTASWSTAACPARAAKPGGTSRAPPRRTRPSCSTTPRRAASSLRSRSKPLLGVPILSGPSDVQVSRAGARGRHDPATCRTTATRRASA